MAKSISPRLVSVLPVLSPAARRLVVSCAVNSTWPSPATGVCVETAPPEQPSHPLCVSELPVTITPAAFVHTTSYVEEPDPAGVKVAVYVVSVDGVLIVCVAPPPSDHDDH